MTPAPPSGERGALAFELSEDEARIAADRAGLRRALAGRLTLSHLAPLAAFSLAIAFAAILALTGLVSRRHGQLALLVAAGAFMVQRLLTRRRLFKARRANRGEIDALRAAGPLTLSVDDKGLALDGAGVSGRWNFADGLEVENAGGLIYIWPPAGSPAVAPTRAFADADAAAAFVADLRARLAPRLAPPPANR